MTDLRDPLPGHDVVAVLGLGAAGRAACRLLDRLAKTVVASDRRIDIDAPLPDSVELRLGGNDIGDATVAILSPGLNPEWPENRDSPALRTLWAAADDGRVSLRSEIELAIAAAALPTITVGGTDGKSTTAAMIRDLLAAAGRRLVFGGNSWTALSDVLVDADTADACVAEVSAFQLWEGHELRPDVAVLTNIAPDHLDHYADEEAYVRAKLRILDHMSSGTVVVNAADPRLADAGRAARARGALVWAYGLHEPDPSWSHRAWVDGDDLRLDEPAGEYRVPKSAVAVPGSHNLKNALAALVASRSLLGAGGGLGSAEAAAALAAFRGLPHRLELVRELDGVTWLDDSKATNIHAAVTGLTSLACPVVAIVGGVDKDLDLNPLFDALDARARHVVVIGEIADRFTTEAAARGGESPWSHERAGSMEDAVERARVAAAAGDAVVLAPGCSSFDMFGSFEHRGRVYQHAVRSLTTG